MEIRDAKLSDVEGIAKVHVDTWRTTYTGIVPDEFLAKLSHERRVPMWTEVITKIANGERQAEHLLVAIDDDGSIIGFVSSGKNRAPEYPQDGELYAIYLRKHRQGAGIGRRLMEQSIARLADSGFRQMLVWVLADNPTCGFYAKMGGRVVGEKMETIGGKALKELAYGWDSLPIR